MYQSSSFSAATVKILSQKCVSNFFSAQFEILKCFFFLGELFLLRNNKTPAGNITLL